MNILTVDNITKSYGVRKIFEGKRKSGCDRY